MADDGAQTEKQFYARLDDLIDRVEHRYEEVRTDFLEPHLQQIAVRYLQGKHIHRYKLDGGYPEAERKRLILYPDYMEDDHTNSEIALIRQTGNFKFTEANHRDYLGAMMSLGLRREKFGDFIVTESGCDFFTVKETVDYILTNSPRVRHVPTICTELTGEDWEMPTQEYKELAITVTSIRLDAVIAHGFGLSRTKAIAFIQAGHVKINHMECLKNDAVCREQDIISCKGKGKLKVIRMEGESKKGKQKLLLWKYI